MAHANTLQSTADLPSHPLIPRPSAFRFDLAAASGPFRLDHGDVLYAPNVCRDANVRRLLPCEDCGSVPLPSSKQCDAPLNLQSSYDSSSFCFPLIAQGRTLLWAWLQERRPPGTAATYAGCLSLPRQLTLSQDSRRLLQQPVPEVSQLRRSFHGQPGDGSVGSPAAGTAAVLSGSSHVSSGSGAASGAAPMVAAGFSGKGGWYAEWAEIEEGRPLEVEGLPGPQLLDLELSFRRCGDFRNLLACMLALVSAFACLGILYATFEHKTPVEHSTAAPLCSSSTAGAAPAQQACCCCLTRQAVREMHC